MGNPLSRLVYNLKKHVRNEKYGKINTAIITQIKVKLFSSMSKEPNKIELLKSDIFLTINWQTGKNDKS